jgi:hypothetical protein
MFRLTKVALATLSAVVLATSGVTGAAAESQHSSPGVVQVAKKSESAEPANVRDGGKGDPELGWGKVQNRLNDPNLLDLEGPGVLASPSRASLTHRPSAGDGSTQGRDSLAGETNTATPPALDRANLPPAAAPAYAYTISGTVTNASGNPVPAIWVGAISENNPNWHCPALTDI